MSKITATLYLDEKYRDFSLLVRSQKKQVSKVIDGFIDDYLRKHQEELNALKLKNDIMTEIKDCKNSGDIAKKLWGKVSQIDPDVIKRWLESVEDK